MKDDENLQEQKAEVRIRLKQIRATMPESLRSSHSRMIHEHLTGLDEVISARSVFIYISHGTEVDTHPVICQLLADGKALAVPRIVDARHMNAVPFTIWENLKPDKMGILTPEETDPCPENLDIAITPGLGFTIAGKRIGFGRGYYDQWFRANTVKSRIALAFEAQLVESLPCDNDDVPMDIIVTEKRVIRVIHKDDD